MQTQSQFTSPESDLAATEAAMKVLEMTLPMVARGLPPAERERFENALLNVAVNRLMHAEGASAAATILWRIADAMASGQVPDRDRAIEITCLDA